MLQDFYIKASPLKKLLMKAVILYGAFLVTAYLIFRAYYINFQPELSFFAILLYLAEFHTIILMYGMLYSLWPRNYKSYDEENNRKDLQVNLFVTAAGEPNEVVIETITEAKKAADYYEEHSHPQKKPRVVLLDDSKARGRDNWIELDSVCQKLGIHHIVRPTNEGFKAGNINNGLSYFPADDPHTTIDCFFDSDFCAKKEFVVEILKPLSDESVDFVQSPQRYKNLNTWVAKAAGTYDD
jgi:cellulose synthase (UDP-forming)